ncbi:MAG: alpha/beta fold hydrolase [Anaerolineae bacterium]|nr:alpha/beta fold hydrolase [Anaerolineae bacterium]
MTRIARVVIGLAVLAGLAGGLPAAAQDGLPRFEAAACMIPLPAGEQVDCGYLLVPEDRTQPDSPTIRLAVAILRSKSAAPAPDPVLYLEGGPGGSPIVFLEEWLDSPLRDTRDLILLDQRGTGFSRPLLDCPELDVLTLDLLDEAPSPRVRIARQTAAAFNCRDRLLAAGVNLAAYNSAASAVDVADLRAALGYDTWNLYGISYGTRLALTTLRDYPEGIRSVVLDSVYPPVVNGYAELVPNGVRAFEVLFAACAADTHCNAAFPDLAAAFSDLVVRLDADPPLVPVMHPFTGGSYQLLLTGDVLIETLFGGLYVTELIPYLPYLIHQADNGAYVLMANIAMALLVQNEFSSEGMYYSVECYEEVPFHTGDDLRAAAEAHPDLAGFVLSQPEFAICGDWGAGTAGAIETQPVISDVPTLVLSGEYDPITPPAWGQIAAETLSRSYFYEFPGLGHGVTYLSGDCPVRIMTAFVDDPLSAPDALCIEGMGPPVFLTP